MGVVISVAAILIPIVNVLLFALSIQRFISKRNNKRVLHKLNDEIVQRLFPLPKLRDIQEIVRKNNIAGHLENELVKSYKRVLNYGIEMIEAIALLYLIDTYIAQCSACEKLKDQDNVANK